MRAAPIEFTTPRLALVAWQDRHRAPFAEMNRDPQVMRYFPALLTAEQTHAGIDVWKAQFEDRVFKHPFSLPSAPGKALDTH